MRAFATLVFSALCPLSCSSGVRGDVGDDAMMQIPGAQFVRGPMPDGSASGPSVEQITLMTNDIWAGLTNDPISGALSPTSTSVAIGLKGDVGYWVLVAGVPSISTPADPSFSATLAFSTAVAPGSYTLSALAIDDSGNLGRPSTQVLAGEASPTNPAASGDLVVTLSWDTESNLDLYVVDPTGKEIDWDTPSSQPAFSFDQVDGGSYGYIDYDSNANCVIDGLRREDAIWPRVPPSGSYEVRVDAPSLCGQPIAYWTVRVFLYGNVIAEATGVALEADTIGSHGADSGLVALRFSVP